MSRFTKTIASLTAAIVLAGALSTAQAASPAKPIGKMAKAVGGKVGINLNSARISKAALKSRIQRAAARKGIKLTSRQLNRAASSAIDKLGTAGNGPQKGIIHVNIGRFEICIAWGRDKGACKS